MVKTTVCVYVCRWVYPCVPLLSRLLDALNCITIYECVFYLCAGAFLSSLLTCSTWCCSFSSSESWQQIEQIYSHTDFIVQKSRQKKCYIITTDPKFVIVCPCYLLFYTLFTYCFHLVLICIYLFILFKFCCHWRVSNRILLWVLQWQQIFLMPSCPLVTNKIEAERENKKNKYTNKHYIKSQIAFRSSDFPNIQLESL